MLTLGLPVMPACALLEVGLDQMALDRSALYWHQLISPCAWQHLWSPSGICCLCMIHPTMDSSSLPTRPLRQLVPMWAAGKGPHQPCSMSSHCCHLLFGVIFQFVLAFQIQIGARSCHMLLQGSKQCFWLYLCDWHACNVILEALAVM